MENVRANNSTASGSTARADSSHVSSVDNAYTQAMQRLLEQQQLASLAELSNMNQAAATNMFAYSNPYMMTSLAGLGGTFPGMLPGAGLAGMAGVGGTDYQTALAAMASGYSGFPAAALYSPAAMGYQSMPFTPADYASALSAYASSVAANTPLTNQNHGMSLTADRGHTSPALSQSNRCSTAGVTARSSSSRQSTPLGASSTPGHTTTISHRGTPTDSSALHKTSSSPSPKKPRLSSAKKEKVSSRNTQQADMATFYKGLSADEFDVNTHFKNSLGSLYDNGLVVGRKSSPSSTGTTTHLHDSGKVVNNDQEAAGLDLSVKIKPNIVETPAESQKSDTSDGTTRKSVIQASKPLIPATINPTQYCGESDQLSSHSTGSPFMSALYSLSKSIYSKSTPAADETHSKTQYDALPNLKRLSEQLKTEKCEGPTLPASLKSKNVISLLKQNSAVTSDSKTKRKVRKGKAIMETLDDTSAAQRQRNIEEEQDEIKRKLERDVKHTRPGSRVSQKAAKSLQRNPGSAGRGRGRRKTSLTPRPVSDQGTLSTQPTISSEQVKPKRTYIRTKISKEKPVDMKKLAVPFEYGWRRETRLRGVSKNGKMVGEVFYYTPTDKRMRSYNDVSKYLKQLEENQKKSLNKQEQEVKSVGEETAATEDKQEQEVKSVGEETAATEDKKKEEPVGTITNTDHSIAKLTAADEVSPSVPESDAPVPVANGWLPQEVDVTPQEVDETPQEVEEMPQEVEETPQEVDETVSAVKVDGESNGNKTFEINSSSVEPVEPVEPKLVKKPVIPPPNRQPEWKALTKDYFSFNTRVKLGDFMEQKPGERYMLLNDKERDLRIECANEKRSRQMEKLNKMKAKKEALKETARLMELAKVEKEHKQLELAQRSVQTKLKKQLEKARHKAEHEMLKQQRAAAMQIRRKELQEERDRDRLEKQERSKHLLEERERKLRALRQHKAQQRIEKAMMRERQRLGLLNSKIMETRRREEERRRHQMEKIVQKERKQEIRKRQLELSRELKQPVEDLKLPNTKPLPTLNRIPGMKLPAQVFADVLQLHQFITNFYDCLQFKTSIPTLNMFQQALLSDNKQSKQAVDKILCHMLTFGLTDPGVRNSNKFINELGQKLNKCTINEYNFSEILRMFMLERGGSPTELSLELETKPFASLSATLKSRAMVWLCDELNTSQAVTEEIDNNMEQVLNHRRDKWELEGKIRELKSSSEGLSKGGRAKDMDQSDQSDNDEDTNTEQLTNLSNSKPQTSGTPTKQMGEDRAETVEEKKLDKLVKQYSKCCKDVVTRAGTVRTFPYGMDRYRRYYWCLPSFKGILVESHESSVHSASSDPTDCNVTLKDQSDLESTSQPTEVDKPFTNPETPAITSAEPTSSLSSSTQSVCTSSIAKDKTTSLGLNSVLPTPNGVVKPPQPAHSITSWLSNAIDNIFTTKQLSSSPSHTSSLGSAATTSATLCSDIKPSVSNYAAANISHSGDDVDTWFQLDRKLPCDKLERFSPQLIANSLAFMNCVTGSEEQKELEALERLAAKAVLLDHTRPLSPDVQKGWWIITDSEQVKSLSSALHPRALRERVLNRLLNKNKEKIQVMCSEQNMGTDIEFECDERDSEIAKSVYHAVVADDQSTWVEKQCRTIELTILDKVEDLEERVFQASIYTKNWAEKKRHDATDLELVVTPAIEVNDGQKRIIDLVKEKLLLLEAGVERRYLKPPFIKSTPLHISDIVSKPAVNGTNEGSDVDTDDTGDDSKANEDNCSKGLLDWQRAVRGAVNMSQLYISLVQLENCIAWEKSVMRVLCQVCRSDDKEDQLLLCDNCDKGYHTYCFKPKMLTIPNGDWYCWECKSKATSVAHCIRCGKPTGKMAQCHKCPQAIHLDCCSPPLSRVPRKYTCGHCLQISNQHTHCKRRRRSKQKTYESNSESEDMVTQESTDEEPEDDEADLSVCRDIMNELENHKDAEPFREPVDLKAFPQYKKYIKQPMDLSKITEKLTNNQYGSQTEFYDDMIIIFDNCLLFNEDSSVVGKSGKVLRRLFQKRWKQLTSA